MREESLPNSIPCEPSRRYVFRSLRDVERIQQSGWAPPIGYGLEASGSGGSVEWLSQLLAGGLDVGTEITQAL